MEGMIFPSKRKREGAPQTGSFNTAAFHDVPAVPEPELDRSPKRGKLDLSKAFLNDASRSAPSAIPSVLHDATPWAGEHALPALPSPNAASTCDAFLAGCMRRTRGAEHPGDRNTVSLNDLIDPHHLDCLLSHTYYMGEDEYLRHLPLKRFGFERLPPLYVGRDINADKAVGVPAALIVKPGILDKGIAEQEATGEEADAPASSRKNKRAKFLKVDHPIAVEAATKAWRTKEGSNFYPVYSNYGGGVAHSKFIICRYPTFLRVIITGANLMACDLLGDNLFFIQDFPRRTSSLGKTTKTSFETHLFGHIRALNFPAAVADELQAQHDFFAARVHIVATQYESATGLLAEQFGILRIGRLIEQIPASMWPKQAVLESCSGSVGLIAEDWLRTVIKILFNDSRPIPDAEEHLRIVFPSKRAVQKTGLPSANFNHIGCHVGWDSTREALKACFRNYVSRTDPTFMSHQKTLFVQDADNHEAPPVWFYTGSANFSEAAWGKLSKSSIGTEKYPWSLKTSNYELGIMVEGSVLPSMVDGGDWQDLMTYTRPALPYENRDDKPWNWEGYVNKNK